MKRNHAVAVRDGSLPALWGGVECTINRVGDRWFSQLERSGHLDRTSDLVAFAKLGLRAVRQPVLWEQVAPDGLATADWTWADQQLRRIHQLGMEPIVGLLHHGSGPRHTSLVSPCFAGKLAAYAGAVAARYPWVTDYTPVNEPLTTARFSGLYGHWYPHGCDSETFWRALHAQCRATVLAMAAIREVQPGARLVQTDDLGRTWSTPRLVYQAKFNNELRWLAWDLLCGRVDASHALWSWLLDCCHADPADILWFAANRCPPDIIGVNHYVTSERFLDERVERYPPPTHGGNGRDRYADVEAVRVLAAPTGGIGPLLQEAWARYGLPLAVTEVHLHAPREDQLRWLAETWIAACQARHAGIDVQAVTVWALLGSRDWDCLLTRCSEHYEPGAFEVRGDTLRPTAIARLATQLATGVMPQHPVLSGAGWWRRPSRLLHPPVTLAQRFPERPAVGEARAPILITGATGTLGRAFARICVERGLDYRLLDRAQLDIADPTAVRRVLEDHLPWALVNAAGYVRVDDAEADAARCYRENTDGPGHLAAECARAGIALLTFSTDLVFDGARREPYMEDAQVAPLNVYGLSKARAERLVLERHPEALVVRTSAFFGPWDGHNFITSALRALRAGLPFNAASDQTISPTYVPDLVHACLDLLVDGEAGIWHLSNGHALTWADLARRAAAVVRTDTSSLRPCTSGYLALAARRPRYSALGSQRACSLPTLDDALTRCLAGSGYHLLDAA
ncbi:sugar nucleotide-binding protein [Luteimonas sp. MC1572]|uniref:sugar nucleotide-binding protein n=1 Tax=Luteimonas sp. MC1572 TaxID=2799325 RepID=UPI0018F0EEDD|nr:sugar nucleotide-binding protein [Luteimonas sp. MC1572]MBJ6981319.1 sugar nucleotide-binding protein [Luteimonas sp. MC1572]QQO02636.1 sugar nucleotide-binding protein [Luteimonas sp. MC1572]